MTDAALTQPSTAGSDDNCGCCRPPEAKTTDTVIRELEARRDALTARLAQVGAR